MGPSIQATFAILFLSASLLLQKQTPPEFRDYKIVSEVKLVLLDVAARDSGGGFASGLQRENFRVFDNGKEQPIRVFSGEDTPVTVGILIDRSRSMRAKRSDVINAALALIGESNPRDELFVVSFGDQVTFDLTPGVFFTDDRNLLRDALHRQPADGRTTLHDAIIASLNHLEKGTHDRKTLVLISDGGDTASRHDAGDVIAFAKSSGATIHALGIHDENEISSNLAFLSRLTAITGGEVVIGQSKTDFVAACRRIGKDIRSRYTIGFRPPDSAVAETRKIRVAISAPDRGKLIARTREYYVIPASAEKTR
jgi:Ca-activated chloride channel family protein